MNLVSRHARQLTFVVHRHGLNLQAVVFAHEAHVAEPIGVRIFRAVSSAHAQGVCVEARPIVTARTAVVVARRVVDAAWVARAPANAAFVVLRARPVVAGGVRVVVACVEIHASCDARASALSTFVDVQAAAVVAVGKGVKVARLLVVAPADVGAVAHAAFVNVPKAGVFLVANAVAIRIAQAHPIAVESNAVEILGVQAHLVKGVDLLFLRHVITCLRVWTLAVARA